jgi:hypothetical protein
MSFEYFRKRAFNQGISDSYRELRNAAAPRNSREGPHLLKRLLAKAYKKLIGVTSDSELHELHHQMGVSYREGYQYHQMEYRNDPELRAWVHKESYFDGETK